MNMEDILQIGNADGKSVVFATVLPHMPFPVEFDGLLGLGFSSNPELPSVMLQYLPERKSSLYAVYFGSENGCLLAVSAGFD